MVSVTKLAKINNPKGDLYKIFRSSSEDQEICEVYFSEIKSGEQKGWKSHEHMDCLILVVQGTVEFSFKYDENIEKKLISSDDYYLLTIPKNTWFAFKGCDSGTSRIINFANTWHNSDPGISVPI
ncbi:hypothetical protein IMCC1933_24580 [Rhodobacteraceae bacterium IMCC1933]|jgi:mannose-6-phosphate isomerase-like protein (cupin superfamily)|nr:hypothetical protein [Rhodobacteraceae bacterium IMCC1923]MDP4068896.1 hypothetical protein [Rhodobacteraceae bacterium IMCC1933]